MKGKILLIGLLALAVALSGCTQPADGTTAQTSGKITAEGQSLEMAISPSVDNRVRGTVSLEASNAASGVNIIAFAIQGDDIPEMDEGNPNLGDVPYAGDAIFLLDTTQYNNGVYTVSALAYGDYVEGPPADIASAQVVIEN